MSNKSSCTKGFTLIELLVVVLTIGILASVALPQYQKAVERSRATQALTLLKAVGQAFDVYYLANGAYTKSLDDLSVDIPWTGTTKYSTTDGSGPAKSNDRWTLQIQADDPAVGSVVIHMMQISGKYKGSGFSMAWVVQTGQDKRARRISCSERVSSQKVNFFFDPSLTPGAYCEKIMHGTLITSSKWDRNYSLP